MDTLRLTNVIFSLCAAVYLYHFSISDTLVILFFAMFTKQLLFKTNIVERNIERSPKLKEFYNDIKTRFNFESLEYLEKTDSITKLTSKVEFLENEIAEIKTCLKRNTVNTKKTDKNELRCETVNSEISDDLGVLRIKVQQLQDEYSFWFASANLQNTSEFRGRANLPIGTIMPWLNRIKKPDGVFTSSPDVPPKGWLLCDGQKIENGPWTGLKVPNINAEKGLFLRGGPHYLCGKEETDRMENHRHKVTETKLR